MPRDGGEERGGNSRKFNPKQQIKREPGSTEGGWRCWENNPDRAEQENTCLGRRGGGTGGGKEPSGISTNLCPAS